MEESETGGGDNRGHDVWAIEPSDSYLQTVLVSKSEHLFISGAEQISTLQSKDWCTLSNHPVQEGIISPFYR
jgi:hypothetical protein